MNAMAPIEGLEGSGKPLSHISGSRTTHATAIIERIRQSNPPGGHDENRRGWRSEAA